MKQVFGWSAKYVVVPLLPFGIGALIRFISGVSGAKEVFDAGELCFSMAMLSMLVISSAGKLNDKDLRDGLINTFTVVVVVFIVLFTVASIYRIQVETGTHEALSRAVEILKNGGNVLPAQLEDPQALREKSVLDKVWICTVIPSVLTILAAMICKFKYKLED